MKTTKTANYLLITKDEISFSDFFSSFKEKETAFDKENIIIQFSDEKSVSEQDILLFLIIAKQKKENGTSFVIINSAVSIDNFPETLNITPTLQEAEDIIEMEAIERELGF